MNERRQKLVQQAFNILDQGGDGVIDIEDIKSKYNARYHPDVKQGKRTEEEVLMEFIETFEAEHNYLASQRPDGKVTPEEFLEYYENVSMSIDDDAYFELMMNNAWRMNENTTYNNEKKGWSNKEEGTPKKVSENYKEKFQIKKTSTPQKQKSKIADTPTIEKLRKTLQSRGGRGIIGLAKQFKIFDDNNNKTLEYDEFCKAMKDFRVG